MRFHSFSLLLIAIFSSWASAQFTYPPPLTRPLSDYTSGQVKSALNFSAGDNMFGGWSTPGKLMSYMVYRCNGNNTLPFTKPIAPLNSTFNSDNYEGKFEKDGTWGSMPLFDPEGLINGMQPGKNPIWFHGEFVAPNATTGDLCWFELYPGHESPKYSYKDPRKVEVYGDSEWYFATIPFTVRPARASGLNVTWKSDGTERGKPTKNILGGGSNSSSTDDADAPSVTLEFCAGTACPPQGKSAALPNARAASTFVQGLFAVPWVALGVTLLL